MTGDGDCYEVAGNYVINMIISKGDKAVASSSAMVCHGTVLGQGAVKGVWFGHAWIEEGSMVIDKSNGNDIKMPKILYYDIGNIKDVKRYTLQEARKEMNDSGHYGPW